MKTQYLNEFHKRNCRACREALRDSARRPLTVEDVLEQSRRNGRATTRRISSERDIFRKRADTSKDDEPLLPDFLDAEAEFWNFGYSFSENSKSV